MSQKELFKKCTDNYHLIDTKGNITFCILYAEEPYTWRNFYEKMFDSKWVGANYIEQLINKIKSDTKSKTLDWHYFAGRPILCIKENESDKIMNITQNILDLGYRLLLNDGTGITIHIDKCPKYNWNTREALVLKYFKEMGNKCKNGKCPDLWKGVISYGCKISKRYKNKELCEFCLEHFPKVNETNNDYYNF